MALLFQITLYFWISFFRSSVKYKASFHFYKFYLTVISLLHSFSSICYTQSAIIVNMSKKTKIGCWFKVSFVLDVQNMFLWYIWNIWHTLFDKLQMSITGKQDVSFLHSIFKLYFIQYVSSYFQGYLISSKRRIL